jgi:hypothetical protein
MRRKPVSSSVIASVGYAAQKRILEIEFVSGRIYQYLDVEPAIHDALLKAPSLCTFFNECIKDEYEFVRIA